MDCSPFTLFISNSFNPKQKTLLIFTVHVAYKTYVKPTQMQSGESL